jgi:hypothetical protein
MIFAGSFEKEKKTERIYLYDAPDCSLKKHTIG